MTLTPFDFRSAITCISLAVSVMVALVAPFIGILHDRAFDGALAHSSERDWILVKAYNLYLAELTGFLQH